MAITPEWMLLSLDGGVHSPTPHAAAAPQTTPLARAGAELPPMAIVVASAPDVSLDVFGAPFVTINWHLPPWRLGLALAPAHLFPF